MKKSFLYILLAAVALMGCSKERFEDTRIPDEDAWKTDVTLPVPVQFGQIATKAAVTDINQLKGEIGILGLDRDATAWTGGAAGKENNFIFNAPAKVQDGYISFTEGPKYYPMENTQNFAFYGYYPRVDDSKVGQLFINDLEHILGVEYVLDGKTDILWAKDIVTEKHQGTYDGFNGRYIRKGGKAPVMNFRHLLTSLKFKVRYDATNATDAELAAPPDIKVTKVVLKNVTTNAKLAVADIKASTPVQDEGSPQLWRPKHGLLHPFKKGNIEMVSDYKENLSLLADGQKKLSDPQLVCEALVYTDGQLIDDNELNHYLGKTDRYDVSFYIQKGSSPEEHFDFSITNNETYGFLAGHVYTVNVTVKNPTEVKISATLESWSDENFGQDIIYGDAEGSEQQMAQ